MNNLDPWVSDSCPSILYKSLCIPQNPKTLSKPVIYISNAISDTRNTRIFRTLRLPSNICVLGLGMFISSVFPSYQCKWIKRLSPWDDTMQWLFGRYEPVAGMLRHHWSEQLKSVWYGHHHVIYWVLTHMHSYLMKMWFTGSLQGWEHFKKAIGFQNFFFLESKTYVLQATHKSKQMSHFALKYIVKWLP